MTERLPPEVQQHVVKLQQLQSQLSQILSEKNVVEGELREINRALDILKDLEPGTPIFKSVGHLLVKVSKENVEKELNDRKEILELRLKSLEKQEQLLRNQLNEVQSKVNEYLAKLYTAKGKAS